MHVIPVWRSRNTHNTTSIKSNICMTRKQLSRIEAESAATSGPACYCNNCANVSLGKTEFMKDWSEKVTYEHLFTIYWIKFCKTIKKQTVLMSFRDGPPKQRVYAQDSNVHRCHPHHTHVCNGWSGRISLCVLCLIVVHCHRNCILLVLLLMSIT